MRQLVYKVCYTRCQGSFYLWRTGPVPISKAFCKSLTEDFSFALYTFNDDSNFWKKRSFGSKMLVLSKNYQ